MERVDRLAELMCRMVRSNVWGIEGAWMEWKAVDRIVG
jgi:hypothetical protein